MKKIFFLLMLILFTYTAESQNFDDDVKHLMKASGSETNINSVVTLMLNSFKGQELYKNIPNEFWAEISKEIKESYLVLEDKLIVIYKQNYSHEEIRR